MSQIHNQEERQSWKTVKWSGKVIDKYFVKSVGTLHVFGGNAL